MLVEINKNYRKNNAEKIAAKTSEKLNCECVIEIKRGSNSKHIRTKRHFKLIQKASHNLKNQKI